VRHGNVTAFEFAICASLHTRGTCARLLRGLLVEAHHLAVTLTSLYHVCVVLPREFLYNLDEGWRIRINHLGLLLGEGEENALGIVNLGTVNPPSRLRSVDGEEALVDELLQPRHKGDRMLRCVVGRRKVHIELDEALYCVVDLDVFTRLACCEQHPHCVAVGVDNLGWQCLGLELFDCLLLEATFGVHN